jgi:uncharacterized protein (DUF1330 family)
MRKSRECRFSHAGRRSIRSSEVQVPKVPRSLVPRATNETEIPRRDFLYGIRWTHLPRCGYHRVAFIFPERDMAKGYWVTFYRSISNPDAVTEYAKLAGPALQAAGAKILSRGVPAKTFEAGLAMRSVVIEFESVEKAIATFESPAYQAAAKLLKGAAERDIRILEGV